MRWAATSLMLALACSVSAPRGADIAPMDGRAFSVTGSLRLRCGLSETPEPDIGLELVRAGEAEPLASARTDAGGRFALSAAVDVEERDELRLRVAGEEHALPDADPAYRRGFGAAPPNVLGLVVLRECSGSSSRVLAIHRSDDALDRGTVPVRAGEPPPP